MEDEVDERIKKIWEMFMLFEIEHMRYAAELVKKYDKKDPEEIIGTNIVIPCRFKSQKKYVQDILKKEIDKRLDNNMGYTTIDELPDDWESYSVQEAVAEDGAPTETTIRLIMIADNRDIVEADDALIAKQPQLLAKGLQDEAQAPNTVSIEEYEEMGERDD